MFYMRDNAIPGRFGSTDEKSNQWQRAGDFHGLTGANGGQSEESAYKSS